MMKLQTERTMTMSDEEKIKETEETGQGKPPTKNMDIDS